MVEHFICVGFRKIIKPTQQHRRCREGFQEMRGQFFETLASTRSGLPELDKCMKTDGSLYDKQDLDNFLKQLTLYMSINTSMKVSDKFDTKLPN